MSYDPTSSMPPLPPQQPRVSKSDVAWKVAAAVLGALVLILGAVVLLRDDGSKQAVGTANGSSASTSGSNSSTSSKSDEPSGAGAQINGGGWERDEAARHQRHHDDVVDVDLVLQQLQ